MAVGDADDDGGDVCRRWWSSRDSLAPEPEPAGCQRLRRFGRRRGSQTRQIARDCGDAGLLQVGARRVYCGQLRRLPRLPRPRRRDADKMVVVGGRMTLTFEVVNNGLGGVEWAGLPRRGRGGSRARRGRSLPGRVPPRTALVTSASSSAAASTVHAQQHHTASHDRAKTPRSADCCSLPRYRDLVLRLAPSPRMY